MAQTSPLHEHCELCFNVKTCYQTACPPYSCDIIKCDLLCGASFHSCKAKEHEDLCPKEKVPCINKGNGCPVILNRHNLGVHLSKCPASVIYCTMEWNRWPVYSQERQARVPFSGEKVHARYGQLDVTLALRDQRMLNKAMKAPKSTRHALRSHLTKRFPAVPIMHKEQIQDTDGHFSQDSTSTSCTVSDDDSDAPWQQRKHPPGLQSSVCNELFKATKQTTESLTAALQLINTPAENSCHGNPSLSCDTSTVTSHSCDKPLSSYGANEFEIKCRHCAKLQKLKHSGESGHDNRSHGDGSHDHIDQNITCDKCNVSQQVTELSCDIGGDLVNTTARSPDGQSSLSPGSDDIVLNHLDIGLHTMFTNPQRNVIPEPPTESNHMLLNEILGLDLNIEQITRYQPKPSSMYTFLCAQFFRRDEYPWHFKNLHGDIHAGMNGWLEQRCPMAQEGCTFSQRRLYPMEPGSEVVYSRAQESFGIKRNIPRSLLNTRESMEREYLEYLRKTKGTKEATPEIFTSKDFDAYVKVHSTVQKTQLGQNSQVIDNTADLRPDLLTTLPFEILQHIGRFLDGFSMNHLSLTCKTLRDICRSLLNDKGVVVQEWERGKIGDKVHWYIAYQRWLFSTCFEPVTFWGFQNNAHMSEHLKSCHCYQGNINRQEEPYNMAGVFDNAIHNKEVKDILHRMYPDVHKFME